MSSAENFVEHPSRLFYWVCCFELSKHLFLTRFRVSFVWYSVAFHSEKWWCMLWMCSNWNMWWSIPTTSKNNNNHHSERCCFVILFSLITIIWKRKRQETTTTRNSVGIFLKNCAKDDISHTFAERTRLAMQQNQIDGRCVSNRVLALCHTHISLSFCFAVALVNCIVWNNKTVWWKKITEADCYSCSLFFFIFRIGYANSRARNMHLSLRIHLNG